MIAFRTPVSLRAVLLFAALFLSLGGAASYAQQKYALVIGNGAYTNVTKLNNPVNDAADMKTTLESLGWTVDLVLNGSLDRLETAVVRLKNRLSVNHDSYGLFFYAGHGVQSSGENYLIPVDANIQSENFLRQRAVSVQAVLGELNDAGNALNIVVLDACRDNPFSWKRGSSRGLQGVGSQPADSIIVYATSAGSVAQDGTGRNGLFTTHLLNNLKTPGLSVQELFNKTGSDVRRASDGSQIPAVYSQFFETAWLGTKPAAVVQPAPASMQPAAPPVRPAPANMVYIRGGTFQMGSLVSEAGRGSDETQRQVTVGSFYMGKYEVSQKEWVEIMGSNPSYFKGDNLPVENISWYDAVEYCNRLSVKEGFVPAYHGSGDNITCDFKATGYRLPTEAEWEYACRAGTTTSFNTGNNISANTANYGRDRGKTTAMESFAANVWGLYDMHGNVWEWCWDWYGSYSSRSQTNPVGASSGSYRVLRGGVWDGTTQNARSANRSYHPPASRYYNLGFRLLRPRFE
jgi:formylglycine-generating enzyme required for sulfatase activity